MKRLVLLSLAVLPVYGYGEDSNHDKSVLGLSIQSDGQGGHALAAHTQSLADKAASLWNGVVSFPQTASVALNKFFLQATEDIQEHYVLSGACIIAMGWLAKNSYDKRSYRRTIADQVREIRGLREEKRQLRSDVVDRDLNIGAFQQVQDALFTRAEAHMQEAEQARRERDGAQDVAVRAVDERERAHRSREALGRQCVSLSQQLVQRQEELEDVRRATREEIRQLTERALAQIGAADRRGRDAEREARERVAVEEQELRAMNEQLQRDNEALTRQLQGEPSETGGIWHYIGWR
ncbi:hypothetical protein JW872_02735 [Candidatus Babeliales bacterium]|nr:hypothetical protein [Candidatus Babeliales bacterium]